MCIFSKNRPKIRTNLKKDQKPGQKQDIRTKCQKPGQIRKSGRIRTLHQCVPLLIIRVHVPDVPCEAVPPAESPAAHVTRQCVPLLIIRVHAPDVPCEAVPPAESPAAQVTHQCRVRIQIFSILAGQPGQILPKKQDKSGQILPKKQDNQDKFKQAPGGLFEEK